MNSVANRFDKQNRPINAMSEANHTQYGHHNHIYYPEHDYGQSNRAYKQIKGQMLNKVRDALWKLYRADPHNKNRLHIRYALKIRF